LVVGCEGEGMHHPAAARPGLLRAACPRSAAPPLWVRQRVAVPEVRQSDVTQSEQKLGLVQFVVL
jgi:hypothetical protein